MPVCTRIFLTGVPDVLKLLKKTLKNEIGMALGDIFPPLLI